MNKIAIFFPGIGYHCDKPLLYYGRDIAYEQGYETCRNVQYSYSAQNIRGNQEKMQEAFESLYTQAEQYLADLSWDSYEDILVVSKSIGTIIAAAYAKKHNLSNVRHVLYTPLVQTFDFKPQNAIAFIGTADAWSDAGEIVRLANEEKIPIQVYEGCNHSLEGEDTMKDLEILADVMRKTKEFLCV